MQIGDTLTTKEFNKIIYLLRQNQNVIDGIEIGTETINTSICDLEFTINGGVFTDAGILVSNTDGLDLTVKMLNCKINFGVPYLRLTVYSVNNYHEQTEPSKVKTQQLNIKLYPTTNRHIDGLSGDRVKIIGYNAEVYLDLSSSDYEYIKGLRLYPRASKYLIVEDETVDIINEAMSSLNKPLRRDATINFYELFDYSKMDITADNEIISPRETNNLNVTLKDSDDSKIEGANVNFFEKYLLFQDVGTTDKSNDNYYTNANDLTKTVNDEGTTLINNDTVTRYYCLLLPDTQATSLSEAKVFKNKDYELNVDILGFTGGSIQINGSQTVTRNLSTFNKPTFHLKIIKTDRTYSFYVDNNDTPIYSTTASISDYYSFRFGLTRGSEISFKNLTIDTDDYYTED